MQFLLENGKNAVFYIKSPLKIFTVGPKGGALHRGPPPKYATVLYLPLLLIFSQNSQISLAWQPESAMVNFD